MQAMYRVAFTRPTGDKVPDGLLYRIALIPPFPLDATQIGGFSIWRNDTKTGAKLSVSLPSGGRYSDSKPYGPVIRFVNGDKVESGLGARQLLDLKDSIELVYSDLIKHGQDPTIGMHDLPLSALRPTPETVAPVEPAE